MNHYYQNNTDLKTERRHFEYGYRGNILKFESDLGVFSKDRVDYGTHVLLKNLEDLSKVKTILDVGCGIGIMGVSVAKAYPQAKVLMVDVNDRAIELANLNSKNNGLNTLAIHSDLYENVSESFDLIISNPPIRAGKNVVHGVVEKGYEHLNKGGCIYVVIQKKQGAESMKKKMEEVGAAMDKILSNMASLQEAINRVGAASEEITKIIGLIGEITMCLLRLRYLLLERLDLHSN